MKRVYSSIKVKSVGGKTLKSPNKLEKKSLKDKQKKWVWGIPIYINCHHNFFYGSNWLIQTLFPRARQVINSPDGHILFWGKLLNTQLHKHITSKITSSKERAISKVWVIEGKNIIHLSLPLAILVLMRKHMSKNIHLLIWMCYK